MLKINSATASAKMIPNKILLSHIVLAKHSHSIPRFEWSLVIGNARDFPADALRGVLRLLALVARFAKHVAAVEDNCPNRQTILGAIQPKKKNVVDFNAKATANGLNVRITYYYFSRLLL